MPPTAEVVDPNKPAEVVKPVEKPAEPGAVASSFIERMTSGLTKKKAKETPPVEPAKPKEVEKPKEEVKPAVAAKPAAPKKVAPLPPPVMNADDIAEAASRGVVAAMAKAKPVEEKPKEPSATEGFSEDERETHDVLARMEKDFGTQYAGRAAKYSESLKKAKTYQANWEAANPGRQFEADAPEHNDFFEANDVEWNDTHFNRTLARMEAERLLAAERAKDNKKINELERQNKLRDEEPKILAKRREAAKTFFGGLGDDFKAIISDDGRIDMAEVKRITDADPLKMAIFDAADSVEAFSAEMYRMTNGLSEYNENNPSHKFIGDFVTKQETLLRNLPSEQQIDDQGRRFATAEEYNSMPPSKRLYYWKLTPDDVTVMYAGHEAKLAQERIAAEEKRIEEIAAKRGFVKKEAVKPVAEATPPKPVEKPAPVVQKPVSPAGVVEPIAALPAGAAGGNGQSKLSTFKERWTGIR